MSRRLIGPCRPRAAARRELMRGLAVPLAVAVAFIFSGCAGTGQYFKDRGSDAAEIIQLHGVAALGAGAKLEVTRLAGIGFVAYGGHAAGLANGHAGTWREAVVSLGLPPVLNKHVEHQDTAPGGFVSGSYGTLLYDEQGPKFEHDSTVPYDWLTCRATVVLFLGVDCELRVNQLGDFVVGLFGRDPLADDAGSKETERAWGIQPTGAIWEATGRRAAAWGGPHRTSTSIGPVGRLLQ